MQCEEKYYTYIYYDPLRNNIPVYVGKGCDRRAWCHLSRTNTNNRLFNRLRTLRKRGVRPVIGLYAGLDEEFSLFLEEELISKFGRKDLGTGTLYNLTNGGDGASPSTETKMKISVSLSGKEKSLVHKNNIKKSMKGKPGRIGKENPFYGKSHTEESLKKISETSKNRIYTEEARRNMSESAKKRWQR